MGAFEDIQAELLTAGFDAEAANPLAAAIEAEGLDVVPSGGGPSVAAGEEAAYEVRPFAGRPGWYIHSVSLEGIGGVYQWIAAAAGVDGRVVEDRMRPVFVTAGGSGGGGASPGGTDGQFQYKSGSSFAGAPDVAFDAGLGHTVITGLSLSGGTAGSF